MAYFSKINLNFVDGGYVPLSEPEGISKKEFISLLESPDCVTVYPKYTTFANGSYRASGFVVALCKL